MTPIHTRPLLEEEWKDQVIHIAKLNGWRVTHFRPARTAKGWRTAVQGDKGFPDLVLARPGDLILAELKTDTGRLAPEQRAWLEVLGDVAVVWRPRDRDAVVARLARNAPPEPRKAS